MYNYLGENMKKVVRKKYKLKKKFYLLILVLIIFIMFYFYYKDIDNRKLRSIGYSKNEIAYITTNKIDKKILKKKIYISNLKEIVENNNYNRENLDKYLKEYAVNKDINTIITMVNNDIKYEYSSKLSSLINNKYFILRNLDRYMNYDSSDINTVITMVNSNRDNEFYTNVKEANTDYGILMLVNKYYYLSKDYVYGKLVTLDSKYSNNSGMELNSECYEALKKLIDDAEKEGLHIRNNYAYRSYSYQDSVYNNYKKSRGVVYADSISARSGYSEHQTGLSLDVGVATKYANGKFQDSKEFVWMRDNSYKYGFILRYPEGKENITGYGYEPWHYRYVGVDAASYIYENDITFEEYYAYFVEK